MIKIRKMDHHRKINIWRHMLSYLNIFHLKMRIIFMMRSLLGLLMGLIKRDNIRLLSMKEKCNLKNCRKNIRIRRGNLRPWTKLKRRVRSLMVRKVVMRKSRWLSLRKILMFWRRRPMKRRGFWPRPPQWS